MNELFEGDAIPLVQYLAENKHITSQDIDRLKTLLNDSDSQK